MAVITQIDLSTNIGRFKLKSPIMSASGTFGYADEYDEFMDVKNIGAVLTKAISVMPREGNDHLRLFETTGGLINSIGLENVGIDRFFEEKLPILQRKGINFVMNLAGSTIDEYVELAKRCEAQQIEAVEINVSCPNVKSGCLEFGVNEKSLSNLVKSVRDEFNGCLIVKLTPNVTSIESLGLAAQEAGADAVSAINTVKALGLKLTRRNGSFTKTSVQGGLSGQAIKPIALGAVNRLSKAIDIPIIGMGGIYCLEDVFEFMAVGADAIQIGTANFTHPNICETITNDLKAFMQNEGIENIEQLKEELRGATNE